MLQNLSDRMSGILAKVVILFICAMFALWGIHYFLEESKSTPGIAKVNGAKITQAEFDAAYKRQQTLLGPNAQDILSNPEISQALKTATMNDIIRTKVLVDGAEKEKLFISDPQVDSLIQQTPAFQINKRFSAQLFQQHISALGYSLEGFQNMVRDKMLINQVQLAISTSSFALPADIANTVRLTKQKRDIHYLVLPLSKVTLANPISQDEIKKYYDEHKDNYAIPEQVQLQYVELSLTELGNNKSLSKEEVEKQFSDYADKLDNVAYENPNSLTPVAKAINTSVKETDFISQRDTTHKDDPILGNAKVKAAAFSDEVLNQGYNSSVIPLDDNTEIVIRVLNRKPASFQPLAVVQDNIRSTLTKEKITAALKQEGDKLQKAIADGQNPITLAQAQGLQWIAANNISRDNKIIPPALVKAAFAIPAKAAGEKEVSGTFLNSGDYALVKLIQITPGNPKDINESEKEKLAENIENAYGSMDYKLYYDSLRKDASVKINTQSMKGDE